jgi:hypothetical protein
MKRREMKEQKKRGSKLRHKATAKVEVRVRMKALRDKAK